MGDEEEEIKPKVPETKQKKEKKKKKGKKEEVVEDPDDEILNDAPKEEKGGKKKGKKKKGKKGGDDEDEDLDAMLAALRAEYDGDAPPPAAQEPEVKADKKGTQGKAKVKED